MARPSMKVAFPRILILFSLLSSVVLPLFADTGETPTRAALVIGNGAYSNSPLTNPPNDAADMAALFRQADMEVIARNNLDLAGMEKAIGDFVKLLKGKDSAVVFYAGHGVQVNGENYLIPVKESINSEVQVRTRGVSVNDLLERIKGSGVRTVVLFLDACRDNPFPGSTRSGTRGLTVVAAPTEVETLVAYAAAEGKTAADGKGRNGVFSAALLKNLAEPGMNITEAMIKVRADVLAATGGAQAPAVDMRLARPWYLIDPEAAAHKAQEESRQANEALAALDKELADRQARIAAAKDAAAREALELEQKKTEAARRAQQLVAESLGRTAELRREAAHAEELKQAQVNASLKAQEELSAAMARRRAELERLSSDTGGDDPDKLVDTVERLKAAMAEVKDQFSKSWTEADRGIRAGFEPLFAVLTKAEPELWETDAEFAQRVRTDKAKLEADRAATLSARKSALDAEAARQIAGMQAQLDKALAALSEKTWMVPAAQVKVTVGEYDRNARLWPLSVESTDPMLYVRENFIIDFNQSKELKTELIDFDRAVKANALVGEISWGVMPDPERDRYLVVLRSVSVKNLESGKLVASRAEQKSLAWFKPGERGKAVSLYATVEFSVPRGQLEAIVYVNGDALGETPLQAKVYAGNAQVRYEWPDGSVAGGTQNWTGGVSYKLRMKPERAIRGEIYIPGGTFRMGSENGDKDEKPVHSVTVSGFWMMKTEVTQKDYAALMRKNPSRFRGDDLPVDQVSWYDAVAYANKLSQRDGLTPAYRINGTSVEWDRGADGWRLPTEAEWEYAARGGASSRGYTYAGGSDVESVAWYDGNSGYKTHPVGQKAANELGLYDMSGNVWEWCWDWYGSYGSGAQTDPTGAASGTRRVLRGGSWDGVASFARTAIRSSGAADCRHSALGFRLVRPVRR